MIALKYENDFEDYFIIDGTLDYNSKKVSEAHKTTPKTNAANRTIMHTKRTKEILNIIKIENMLLAKDKKYDEKGFIFVSHSGPPYPSI